MKHAPATPAAHPPGQTRIEALSPEFLDAAAALAAELGLPRDGDADFALQLGADGLQLQELHFTQMPVQTSIDGGVVTWTGTVIANHLYNTDDEFDDIEDEPDEIRRISKRVFAVSALTEIEDFNDFFGTQFSDEEVDTVGGLVMHAFSHLPKKGEEIELDGYLFKVMHADRRRLQQLQVKIPENHAAAQPES